uniref:NTR domain-containing protein n=1 Tax=Heligmosomoides polygyrus TaxID=6339 RepID=A0A183FNN1_HELPZ
LQLDSPKKSCEMKFVLRGINAAQRRGCGSMYSVYVESSAFKGLLKVAQHKMITGEVKVKSCLSLTAFNKKRLKF